MPVSVRANHMSAKKSGPRLLFEYRPDGAAVSDAHVKEMLLALVEFAETHQRHPTLEEEEAIHKKFCSKSDWDSPLSWVVVPTLVDAGNEETGDPDDDDDEDGDYSLLRPMYLCSSFFAYKAGPRIHMFTMQPHM